MRRLDEEMLSTTDCGSSNSQIQNVELGPQPFFGLFGICGTIAAFGLSVTMIGFVGRNTKAFMNYLEGTLLQRGLQVAKSCVGKHLNKYMRSAPAQDVNSPENISANSEQNIVNIELPTTHHSWLTNYINYKIFNILYSFIHDKLEVYLSYKRIGT